MHAVDTKAQVNAAELLEAVSNAERERAAAPGEVPIGQWTALKVKGNLDMTSQPLTSQLQLSVSKQTVSNMLVHSCSMTSHAMCNTYPEIACMAPAGDRVDNYQENPDASHAMCSATAVAHHLVVDVGPLVLPVHHHVLHSRCQSKDIAQKILLQYCHLLDLQGSSLCRISQVHAETATEP